MSEHVQQIYDAWGNRASIKEPDAIQNGERVFKVGGYSITVSDDPSKPAKVAHAYNKWGASENPMPNMSFSDGEMRIPIEDLVDLILRRVPADELAEGLWRDEEVRERFVCCMSSRFSGPIEDRDRRKLLNDIQVQIYAKAIDRAIERLNNLESDLRAKSNRSRWEAFSCGHYEGLYERYQAAIYELHEAGKLDDDGVRQRLSVHTAPENLKKRAIEIADPVTRESVGENWQESRSFWREKLSECFPEPELGETHA